MSAKVFKESDSWGDSSVGQTVWSFKKSSKKIKNNKKDKAKKKDIGAGEEEANCGLFVRAPKFYGLEDPDKDAPIKTKNKKLKRTHEESEGTEDRTNKLKKLKKQTIQAAPVESTQEPTSFADQLRENLKGSRFRFLNEQMYKQTGEESMKIFKDDETAYSAYHEGYRHQVQQWPMNPLDRIIKNLKKL